MGIESPQLRQTFGIEELGLLDATPLKSLDTIVGLCADAMKAPVAALFVFDDAAGSIVIRSIVGDTAMRPGALNVAAAQTASSLVRDGANVVGISNLALHEDTRAAIERRKFGATGFLGAPVLGPAGDVVGALTAMTATERHWTHHERKLIQSYAYLAYEQIMLRAALQTVKLMARERAAVGGFAGFRN